MSNIPQIYTKPHTIDPGANGLVVGNSPSRPLFLGSLCYYGHTTVPNPLSFAPRYGGINTFTTSPDQGDKNWFLKHKFVTGILVIVCIGIVGNAIGGSDSSKASNNTNSGADTVSADAPKEEAKTPEYKEVFSLSGKGTKKSEPFTITGDRFKIGYDCTGDLCQAMLYKADGSLVALIMNTTGSAKDETIQYGKGDYYIDANTVGTFTFKVYDYK